MNSAQLIEKLLIRGDFPLKSKAKTCPAGNYLSPACRFCQRVCPQKAIIIKPDEIDIDKRFCVKCGACLSCPLALLELEGLEPLLLKGLDERLEVSKQVHLRCSRAPSKSGLTVPCLAALKDYYLPWLISSEGTLLWVEPGHCQTCEFKAGDLVQAKRGIWESLIDLFGLKILLRWQSEKPSSFGQERKPESLDRRDFFKNVQKALADQASQRLTQLDWLLKSGTLKKIPSLSIFFQLQQPRQKTVERDLTPWGEVSLTTSCNFCGVCVETCPKNALSIKEENGQKSLVFQLENCTKCRICEAVCPQKAISLSPTTDFSLWKKKAVYVIEKGSD
jgi:ferredoxin